MCASHTQGNSWKSCYHITGAAIPGNALFFIKCGCCRASRAQWEPRHPTAIQCCPAVPANWAAAGTITHLAPLGCPGGCGTSLSHLHTCWYLLLILSSSYKPFSLLMKPSWVYWKEFTITYSLSVRGSSDAPLIFIS